MAKSKLDNLFQHKWEKVAECVELDEENLLLSLASMNLESSTLNYGELIPLQVLEEEIIRNIDCIRNRSNCENHEKQQVDNMPMEIPWKQIKVNNWQDHSHGTKRNPHQIEETS